jgi:hypothetical protein
MWNKWQVIVNDRECKDFVEECCGLFQGIAANHEECEVTIFGSPVDIRTEWLQNTSQDH